MSRTTARRHRLSAGLGLLAVLFQAILFGWHHHDPIFAGHLGSAVVENPAASPQPLDDEDGCEICQVLHQLTAATIDFAAVAPPPAAAPHPIEGETAIVARRADLAFHARAPPPA